MKFREMGMFSDDVFILRVSTTVLRKTVVARNVGAAAGGAV